MLKATLRLLATTDLHAHAFGWDYHSDQPKDGVGLSDLAHMIDAARRECPNTLLLDNGDFLQGSALGDWAAEAGTDVVHPMISAMNALGYDAATLGNHEFSHGLVLLRRAISDAAFPVVSANLASSTDTPLVERSVLIERVISDGKGQARPITIGITGIAPPQTTIWEAAQIDGQVTASEAVPAARQVVEALRHAGADLVVLLAHTGLVAESGHGRAEAAMENVAQPLARTSGADAIILGHSHMVYPLPPDPEDKETRHRMPLGKPAVMPGFFGSHLGQIDLSLQHDGKGWRLGETRAEVLQTKPGAGPHRGVKRACGSAHAAARRWLGARVGESEEHLHNYFARIFPSNIVSLVAAAQADHVRRALAGTVWEQLPLLSAAAPFRAGGRGEASQFTDIAPGRLNLRHIADIYPFPNSIVALLLSGREVMDWLERAVIQFATLTPGGAERPLVQDRCPSFDFDLIDDLSFRIDLTQPPRFDPLGTLLEDSFRIKDLTYRGKRILAGDTFVLATNSFRSAGSGGFAGCRADRVILDDRTPSRAVLAAFLSGGAWQGRNGAFDWGFDPVGCTVTFDSAEKSLFHLDCIAPFRPVPMTGAAPGFQRFRLWV
jgi:2',3'-cyclic-nucleotide 2'-phosphodiesterase / 3'-nucleotidase